MRYSIDSYEQNRVLEIVTLTFAVVAGVWALIMTYSWKQRAGKIAIDFAIIIRLQGVIFEKYGK